MGQCMELVETRLRIPETFGQVDCGYEQLNDLQHLITRHGGTITHTEYAEQLQVLCTVPSLELKNFRQHLDNHFRGQLTFITDTGQLPSRLV